MNANKRKSFFFQGIDFYMKDQGTKTAKAVTKNNNFKKALFVVSDLSLLSANLYFHSQFSPREHKSLFVSEFEKPNLSVIILSKRIPANQKWDYEKKNRYSVWPPYYN